VDFCGGTKILLGGKRCGEKNDFTVISVLTGYDALNTLTHRK